MSIKTELEWFSVNEHVPLSGTPWKDFSTKVEIVSRILILRDEMGEDVVNTAKYSSRLGWVYFYDNKPMPQEVIETIKYWSEWPELDLSISDIYTSIKGQQH